MLQALPDWERSFPSACEQADAMRMSSVGAGEDGKG